MPRRTMNACYETYKNGDRLSDDELKRLHKHMTDAAKLLSPLGSAFKFAFVECLSVSHSTKGYIACRAERR